MTEKSKKSPRFDMAELKFHAIFAIFVAPLAFAMVTLMNFYNPEVAYESIATKLEMSLTATKQGQPGGVAEMFFTSYAAAKGAEASLDPLTARQLKPEVVIGHRGIKLEGDRAVIPSPLHMKIKPSPGQTVEIAAKVNIWFVSERKTTFLGLPARKWRIQSVEYAGDIPKPPYN